MTTRILIFMMMALAIVRCKDSETFIPDSKNATFSASAFVEIRDVNDLPQEGVEVKVGNEIVYTNEDGIANLRNVTMESSTYITAEKSGYFHGSRRFYPLPGQTAFVKIMLLPFNAIGSIQSANGGTVTLTDGTTLSFPSNAIMDLNGNAYNGQVSVSAQPLNAGDPDLSDKMPGDLVGNRENGEQVALASMGMVAVELRSSTGDLLQVKNGSKVEIRMEVPSDMAGHAPPQIPMWYFDESTGFWKEEGEASLEGNTYVAEVGHFSYWNYDAWFPAVKWGATFLYDNGSPATQIEVCITIIELETSKCAYTNAEGIVCGLVAANELLLMEVKTPCGETILSQQIGPFTDSTMIGPFVIPQNVVSITSIDGIAVDCNGDPVTDGFARVIVSNQSYFAVTDATTGTFEIAVMNCDQSDVKIKVLDEANVKQSLVLTFPFAYEIHAGTITACEAITEFIDIEITGFADHVVFLLPQARVEGQNTLIFASDSTQTGAKYFYSNFPGTSPGTFVASLQEIGFELPGTTNFVYATDATFAVTFFGGPGDYILGTVQGTLTTGPNNGNVEYPFSGTFSVLRE